MPIQLLRTLKAPYGPILNTSCWLSEAILRMLINHLSPEVLSQNSLFSKNHYNHFIKTNLSNIISAIKSLQEDETLIINDLITTSVHKTQVDVPRVIFSEDLGKNTSEVLNLIYSLSAGAWVNVGDLGIVSLFYEIFSYIKHTHFSAKSIPCLLTSSLGKLGRLQVLAAQLAGFSCLVLEKNHDAIKESLEKKYTQQHTAQIKQALALLTNNTAPIGISLACQPRDVLAKLIKANFLPDIIIDNTNYFDSLLEQKLNRSRIPEKIKNLLYFHKKNSILKKKEIGISLTFEECLHNYTKLFSDKDYYALRCVALSGSPQDIQLIEEKLFELFPENYRLQTWLTSIKSYFHAKGLPSTVFWLEKKDCVRITLTLNEMVTKGLIKAPLVFASENISLCNMSSSVNIALAALENCARGASWISLNQNPNITGFGIVADGTAIAAKRLQHVFLPAKKPL